MLLVLDLVHVIDGARVPSARHPVLANSRQDHPLPETLLEPARLAPVPLLFRYDTVVLRDASVNSLVLHGSLEEALATLASDDTVMKSGGFVLANHADLWLRIVLVVRVVCVSGGGVVVV